MRFVLTVLTPLVWLFCRVFFRIELHGVENIPATGACIITPNHVTYADPIWITIPVRRRIYYMAWNKPFQIPVLGFLMRTFGAFPLNLDRIDPSAHRSALDLLRRGCALVIFPEGGRTRTGRLEHFKLGAFRLSLTEGIPIVPVSIRGAFQIWPAGRIFPRPGKLVITYHPPITVDRVEDAITRAELRVRARALARRVRAVMATGLDSESLPEEEGKMQKEKGESVSEGA